MKKSPLFLIFWHFVKNENQNFTKTYTDLQDNTFKHCVKFEEIWLSSFQVTVRHRKQSPLFFNFWHFVKLKNQNFTKTYTDLQDNTLKHCVKFEEIQLSGFQATVRHRKNLPPFFRMLSPITQKRTSICLRRHGYPARHVVKKVNKKVNLSFSDGQTLTKSPFLAAIYCPWYNESVYKISWQCDL